MKDIHTQLIHKKHDNERTDCSNTSSPNETNQARNGRPLAHETCGRQHTHTHARTNARNTHTRTDAHTHTHTHPHPPTHKHTRTHARRDAHTHTHGRTHARTLARTHARARARTHARTQTHANARKRTQTQQNQRARQSPLPLGFSRPFTASWGRHGQTGFSRLHGHMASGLVFWDQTHVKVFQLLESGFVAKRLLSC